MNRRDFLTLRTRGENRVVELSCERLYMRYADARSGAGGWEPPPPIGAVQQAWEGEPPTELRTQTTSELFEILERELAQADVLKVLDYDWVMGDEFGPAGEARVEAFRDRGGRVEFSS